jgi:hypothetical protein
MRITITCAVPALLIKPNLLVLSKRQSLPYAELIMHYAMKTYWGVSGYKDPRFLELGTCSKSAVSFTPPPLHPGERDPGTLWTGG